jgi:hypothetical protein
VQENGPTQADFYATALVQGFGSPNRGGTPQIAEYAPDGTRLFRISGTFVYRGTPILPGSFTAQQFRDGMDTQFATGVTAQAAEPPADLANSPLAATLRSMQCCGTPR